MQSRKLNPSSNEVLLDHDSCSALGEGRVVRETLSGGLSDGVELIHVDNGQLAFTVIPTRGMGIYRANVGALELGWDSPVQQIVHPKFMRLEERGGLGWLAGFNELLVRCGVEFSGAPGEDDGRMLSLHGRIANLPASDVSVCFDEKTNEIRISGRVEETSFKFQRFELWCEISTRLNSNQFRVRDRLVNRSAYPQEFQMLYHVNFGSPLLEPNAQFTAPVKKIAPMDAYAMKDLATYPYYLGPTPGYGEQVYAMELFADSHRRTEVLLKNAAGDQGVGLRYRTDTLPFFTLWKNTDSREDGYVTGLEPCTAYPYNRSIARKLGQVSELKPGEEIEFELELEALVNAGQVRAVAERIETISGNKPVDWSDRLANGAPA